MLNTFADAPPLQAKDQTPRALSTKANSEVFRRFRLSGKFSAVRRLTLDNFEARG